MTNCHLITLVRSDVKSDGPCYTKHPVLLIEQTHFASSKF